MKVDKESSSRCGLTFFVPACAFSDHAHNGMMLPRIALKPIDWYQVLNTEALVVGETSKRKSHGCSAISMQKWDGLKVAIESESETVRRNPLAI